MSAPDPELGPAPKPLLPFPVRYAVIGLFCAAAGLIGGVHWAVASMGWWSWP